MFTGQGRLAQHGPPGVRLVSREAGVTNRSSLL